MSCTRREFMAATAAAAGLALAPPRKGRNMPAIVNPIPLRRALQAIPSRPVDIVILYGDSNIAVGGGGWHRAISLALNAAYPNQCFATRFMPGAENNGSGIAWNVGATHNTDYPTGGGWALTGAGAGLDEYLQRSETGVPNVTDGHNARYWYRGASRNSNGANTGASLDTGVPMDIAAANLEVEFLYGRNGAGEFHPTFLHSSADGAPVRIFTETVSWTGRPAEVATYTKTLGLGGNRNVGRTLQWWLNDPFGAGTDSVLGPFADYWTRFYNAGRTKGWSLHVVDHLGGGSAYDGIVRFQQWRKEASGDPSLGLLLGQMRARQIAMGYTPMIHFIIEGIGNDILASEGGTSINGAGANNSPAGVLDNWNQMVVELGEVWAAKGWDPGEYGVTNMLFHAHSAANEPLLQPTRQLFMGWAASQRNATTINLADLFTRPEIEARAGYQPGAPWDYAHLVYTFMRDMLLERVFPQVLAGPTIFGD